MRYPGILILFLSLKVFSVNCQNNTNATGSEGNLYLCFRNTNFVKNNEYSNPITEGYTLLGYFIQPELVCYPSEKLTLKLGAHLLSYSGTGKFSLIKPVFSATLNISKNTSFTLGTLSGSDTHRMLDPHFNKERMYNAFPEDGAQFMISGDHFFNDTWLSWENFIFKGDNEREIFTTGESFRYTTPVIAGLLTFEIPVQLLIKHYGGQISDYPESVETYFNVATGVRAGIDIAGQKYGRAGIDYLYFNGRSVTKNAPSGIESGNASWYRVFYSFRKAAIEAGYWSSHNFFAPNGNYIFGSVSDHIENLVIHDRKLITGSVNITLLPENFLEVFIGFDGYYDTDLKRFDNALSLHIRFNQLIKIAELKRP
jgi:hypothetical protein